MILAPSRKPVMKISSHCRKLIF